MSAYVCACMHVFVHAYTGTCMRMCVCVVEREKESSEYLKRKNESMHSSCQWQRERKGQFNTYQTL